MEKFSFSSTPVKRNPVNSTFRCSQTAIPVPESLPLLAELGRCESESMHGQMPIIWGRAKDFQIFDHWGNTWIDFTSGIFVASVGHSNTRILSALRGLLDQELLYTYNYATNARVEYLKKLIDFAPSELERPI